MIAELSLPVYPENKKIVLVGGCFDLLHYGHYSFLRNARQAGDFLIVALESDAFIRKSKHREPVHSQDQRAEILEALRVVDYVIKLPLLTGSEEYRDLVLQVKPDIIAVTEGDPHIEKKQQHADAVSAQVMTVSPHVSSFSTSGILAYATVLSD